MFSCKYGVIDDSGTKMYMIGFSNKLDILKCLTDEEFQKVKDDREPFNAPSNPYVNPKPGQLGKLLWMSGENCIQIHVQTNKIIPTF